MLSVSEEGYAVAKPKLIVKKNAFNEELIDASGCKGIWISAKIQRYPGLFPVEQKLLGIIDGLTSDKRACWARSSRLAHLMDLSTDHTKRMLGSLHDRGFAIRTGYVNHRTHRVVHPALSQKPEVVKTWLASASNSGAEGGVDATVEGGVDATLNRRHYIEDHKEEKKDTRASALAAEGGSSFSLASLEEGERPITDKTPEEEPAFYRNLKNEQATAEGENGLTPEKEKNFFPSHQNEERRSLSEAETTGDVLAGNPITNISGSGAVGRNGSGKKLKLKRSRRKKPPTEQEVIGYCVSLGLPGSDGVDLHRQWRARGRFPEGEWQAEVLRFRAKGWLDSQQGGAQAEEESPEAVQRRKEAEEKDRHWRQEEDRRRKEEDRRRKEEDQRRLEEARRHLEELHNEYLQNGTPARRVSNGRRADAWKLKRRKKIKSWRRAGKRRKKGANYGSG